MIMASSYSHVFEPIRIRGIDFKNRVFLAPTTPVLSTPDGICTHELVDWLRSFARGGVCTLYLGNCSVDLSQNRDQSFQLDLGNDRCILPLSWYADMCRQYACHASLEINHAGEGVAFETFGRPGWSSSSFISDDEILRAQRMHRDPIPCEEMSKEKIKEVVQLFANAARRMKRAGMDIVMVHGGHGNLISQFTSPKFNHRTDEYGGSTEKRARFAIEVCDAIREACGDDFVIEYRCSGDEIDPEGMHIDETIQLAGYLKGHIDILHVSAGLHSDPMGKHQYYRNWCQNYLMDRCFNVHFAKEIKQAHPDLLVNTVGSITSLDYAEEIIGSGWADFVSMCRPLMADPDMPNKYAEGRPEDRRPCLRCDTCAKHLRTPRHIFCAVNPMSFMTSDLPDGRIPRAPVKKNVAVIGGGPGGITAMETLLDRGHRVTLYEKTGELGGSVKYAALAPFKQDIRDYLQWLRHTADQCCARGARILLNTEASADILNAEGYDAVILALGADPILPNLPGIDLPHVCWAPKAESGQFPVGEKVVVVGGSAVGMEAALNMSLQGKDVTVLEQLDPLRASMKLRESAGSGASELTRLFEEREIPLLCGCTLTEILPDRVRYRKSDGTEGEVSCDTVLLASGMRPRLAQAEAMRHCAPETSVFLVGDCVRAASVYEAVNEAFQVCLHI